MLDLETDESERKLHSSFFAEVARRCVAKQGIACRREELKASDALLQNPQGVEGG